MTNFGAAKAMAAKGKKKQKSKFDSSDDNESSGDSDYSDEKPVAKKPAQNVPMVQVKNVDSDEEEDYKPV
jgi:hypothetical protein